MADYPVVESKMDAPGDGEGDKNGRWDNRENGGLERDGEVEIPTTPNDDWAKRAIVGAQDRVLHDGEEKRTLEPGYRP